MSDTQKTNRPPVHKVILEMLNVGALPGIVQAFAILYAQGAKIPRDSAQAMIDAFKDYLGVDPVSMDLVIKTAIEHLQMQQYNPPQLDSSTREGFDNLAGQPDELLGDDDSDLDENIQGYVAAVLKRKRQIPNIFRHELITAETLTRASKLAGQKCVHAGVFRSELVKDDIVMYEGPGGEFIFGSELGELAEPDEYDDPLLFLLDSNYGIFGPFEDRDTAIAAMKDVWPDIVTVNTDH